MVGRISTPEGIREPAVAVTRVGQFPNLLKLPEEARRHLRQQAGLTEYRLRRLMVSAGSD